jgi:hypothetical protein
VEAIHRLQPCVQAYQPSHHCWSYSRLGGTNVRRIRPRMCPSISCRYAADVSDQHNGSSCSQRLTLGTVVKYYNADTNIVIVRCAREFHSMVAASLVTVTSISKQPCILRSIYCGGEVLCASITQLIRYAISLFQFSICLWIGVQELFEPASGLWFSTIAFSCKLPWLKLEANP